MNQPDSQAITDEQVIANQSNYEVVPTGNNYIDELISYRAERLVRQSSERYKGELSEEDYERLQIHDWIQSALSSINEELIDMGVDPATIPVVLPQQFHFFPEDEFLKFFQELYPDQDIHQDGFPRGFVNPHNPFEAIISMGTSRETKGTILHEAVHLYCKKRFSAKYPKGYKPSEKAIKFIKLIRHSDKDEDLLEEFSDSEVADEIFPELSHVQISQKQGLRHSSVKQKAFKAVDETMTEFITLRVSRKYLVKLGLDENQVGHNESSFYFDAIGRYRPVIFDAIIAEIAKSEGVKKDTVLRDYVQAYISSSHKKGMFDKLRKAFGPKILSVISKIDTTSRPNIVSLDLSLQDKEKMTFLDKVMRNMAKLKLPYNSYLLVRKMSLRRKSLSSLNTEKDMLVLKYLKEKDAKARTELVNKILAI